MSLKTINEAYACDHPEDPEGEMMIHEIDEDWELDRDLFGSCAHLNFIGIPVWLRMRLGRLGCMGTLVGVSISAVLAILGYGAVLGIEIWNDARDVWVWLNRRSPP